ncbi:DegT/DnrJ/EryC1/StrS family aminotransferase [Candidatus Omnitrophota bacterium]
MNIPLFKPSMDEQEINAVRRVTQTGWIGLGPKTREFELAFAKYTGADFAVGLNSCTAALHLALKVLDFNPGDEVITSSLTFVSTNHAILYNNYRPVFADVDENTLTMSIADIKRKITNRTKAIILVHYAGHPCEMDEIVQLCKDKGIIIIEDAAHACGAAYKGRKIGSIGDLTCFSFHAVKNLAMGEGGAITTNNRELDARLRKLRWLGIDKTTWDRSSSANKKYSWSYSINEVGFKCHMDDIHAAIGLIQLKKLERNNKSRRRIVAYYNKVFSELGWITIPEEKSYVESSHHLYVIKVEPRDELIDHLTENGISAGVHYYPNHLYSVYQPYRKRLPVTEKVWKKLVSLPLYPELTESQIDKIIKAMKSFKKKNK